MSVEFRRPSQEIRENPSRHCLFIPAIGATNAGMEAGIGAGLRKKYGNENVTIFNSAISADPYTSNKDRSEQIAKIIKDYGEIELVDVVGHSMGAEEIRRAIQLIREKDENFLEKPQVKENLYFVLIGPSGFSQSIRERMEYVLNYFKLGRPEAIGIDTLTAFPPQDISSSALTQVLSEVSNKKKASAFVPFIDVNQNKEYLEYLSSKDKKKLEECDQDLREAVTDENKRRAREIIAERGRLLDKPQKEVDGNMRGPLQQLYEGTLERHEERRLQVKDVRISSFGLIWKAIGNAAMKEFQRLSQMGYTIDFLVPEYDPVVPLEKVLKFSQRFVVIEQSTHTGVGLQTDLYARIIYSRRYHKEE